MQEQLQRFSDLAGFLDLDFKAQGLDQKYIAQAVKRIESGTLPAFSSCLADKELLKTEEAFMHLAKFKTIIVLGVGGSSLGGQMLQNSLGRYKDAERELFFMDNSDPETMENLSAKLNFSETGFISISKSGGTIETLIQSIFFIQEVEKAQLDVAKHFVVITEPKESKLSKLFAPYDTPRFEHDPQVGGRYSVTSIVGLLPAKLVGFDTTSFIKGAGEVLSAFLENPESVEATKAAAMHVELQKRGYTSLVMMPYSDKLKYFSSWFIQLWAESLGKEGKGTTPILAVGATDQHAQLQLFMDGPADKFVTFLDVGYENEGRAISADMAEVLDQPYLANKTLGDLISCQRKGTQDALTSQDVPTRLLQVESLTASNLGKLVMQMMLETILTGFAWEIDPFDQPAVEDAKIRALDYLERL